MELLVGMIILKMSMKYKPLKKKLLLKNYSATHVKPDLSGQAIQIPTTNKSPDHRTGNLLSVKLLDYFKNIAALLLDNYLMLLLHTFLILSTVAVLQRIRNRDTSLKVVKGHFPCFEVLLRSLRSVPVI